MSETRRLAAILGADVVGCSRLMGENEEGPAPPPRHTCDDRLMDRRFSENSGTTARGSKSPTIRMSSAAIPTASGASAARFFGAGGSARFTGLACAGWQTSSE